MKFVTLYEARLLESIFKKEEKEGRIRSAIRNIRSRHERKKLIKDKEKNAKALRKRVVKGAKYGAAVGFPMFFLPGSTPAGAAIGAVNGAVQHERWLHGNDKLYK